MKLFAPLPTPSTPLPQRQCVLSHAIKTSTRRDKTRTRHVRVPVHNGARGQERAKYEAYKKKPIVIKSVARRFITYIINLNDMFIYHYQHFISFDFVIFRYEISLAKR